MSQAPNLLHQIPTLFFPINWKWTDKMRLSHETQYHHVNGQRFTGTKIALYWGYCWSIWPHLQLDSKHHWCDFMTPVWSEFNDCTGFLLSFISIIVIWINKCKTFMDFLSRWYEYAKIMNILIGCIGPVALCIIGCHRQHFFLCNIDHIPNSRSNTSAYLQLYRFPLLISWINYHNCIIIQ